jgi:phage shock protein A
MTVLQRFFHLAKADAHGVLDSLEDRALGIRQCLREAELDLEHKRARRAELETWLGGLARERERGREREAALERDVELALAQDAEALARFAVRDLLATRKQGAALDVQIQETRCERERLVSLLDAQEHELTELRERARAALARECLPGAELRVSDTDTCGSGVRDEEVELELLRRRAQRSAVAESRS